MITAAATTWCSSNTDALFNFVSNSSTINLIGFSSQLKDPSDYAETTPIIINGIVQQVYTRINPGKDWDNTYDLQTTVTHEFGHWLSLTDLYGIDDNQKVMYGDYVAQRRNLTQAEIDGIQAIYGVGILAGIGDGGNPTAFPTPPQVQASVSSQSVTLTWNIGIDGSDAFQISKNNTNVSYPSIYVSGSSTLSYTDPSGASSLPVTYIVSAYNSAGTANSLPITISSGTISSNTTWQGIVYTNGNVSVNSGCELQIRPGTTILINPGCSITASSGASIIANGTTSAPIHFEQATPGSQWNEIYLRGDNNYFMNCVFDGGTWDMDVEAGQNNNFSYCTFKNAARGLQLNRGSCIIENCTFSNNQDGIILFYGNTASITQSTISNNSDVGLEMYGTTVSEFAHNDIENNGSHGIDVEGGTLYMGNDGMASYLLGTDPNTTTPSFGAGRNRINNNCRTSSSYEIYVNSGGYLYVGNLLYTSPNYYLQDGFNRITDPHSNYIYNLAMTFGYESQQQWTVPAAKTYWGGSVGGENFYGTVDYSYQLTSDPSGGAGATFTPQSTSPANPAKPAQLMTAAMAGKISKEFPVQSQGQFFVDLKNKMMETMNSIVDPKTGITRPRLIGYLNSLCLFDTNDVTQERKPVWSLLYNYRGNLESDNSSTDHTERLCREASLVAEVQNDIRGGELDSAQDLMYGYSSFVQNNDNKRTLLFAKMEIDERDGNYGQALNVLDQIKEFQPDSHQKRKYVAPNYDVLEALLNQEANGLGKSGNYQQQIEESHVPTQMALLQNYPNPFNPSTVISYQLSEISNVTLKVYDVTGREVAVLQDGTKDAGNYSTTFNASDLASGVYFARLMVEPQKGSRYVKTMKMLLLK